MMNLRVGAGLAPARWSLQAGLLALLATPALALQFPVVGARAQAMGGAGVAMGDPAVALYWNPAALGLPQNFALQIPAASVGVDATKGFLGKAKDIADLVDGISKIQGKTSGQGLSLADYKTFLQAIKNLEALNEPGTAMTASIHSGLYLRVTSIAVGALVVGEAGVSPFIDLKNLGLGQQGVTAVEVNTSEPIGGHPRDGFTAEDEAVIADVVGTMKTGAGVTSNVSNTDVANELLYQAAQDPERKKQMQKDIADLKALNETAKPVLTSQGELKNNASAVTARGLAAVEAAVGHGRRFPYLSDRVSLLEHLYAGLSLKLLRGAVFYQNFKVLDEGLSADPLLDQVKDAQNASTKVTADVGLLWVTPLPVRTQVGLVAKNLTAPTFTQPAAAVAAGEPEVSYGRQVRAGIMVNPFWGILKIASDIDLTKNRTFMPGLDSRMFGVGAEVNLWLAALRAGMMKNLADEKSDWIYTAGVSIGPPVIYAELSAALGGARVKAGSLLPGDTTLPLPGYKAGDIPSSFRVQASVGMHF